MAKDVNKTLLKTLSSKIKSKDPKSLLSQLFRKIVAETGMINKMDELKSKYVILSENTDGAKAKTPSQVTASIGSEQMTWATFIDLTVNLLRIKKITFIVKLDHGKSSITGEHKITIHELSMKAIDDGMFDDNIDFENKTEESKESKHGTTK